MINSNGGRVLQRGVVESWLYATWLQFLIQYRRTILGPALILVGPSLFILLLGQLYSGIGGHDGSSFVPHLSIGLIVWTLIGGLMTSSAKVFRTGRAQIMQGGTRLLDVVVINLFNVTLVFAHQTLIIVAVFIFYGLSLTPYALVSLLGVIIVMANGIWVSYLFGIIGARYRDLDEIIQAVMRIAFLATPIIWMPDMGERGGMLGPFLLFNPFYHFLEIVRAPLLGNEISYLSWAIVVMITLAGTALARFVYKRFAQFVPLWV